MKRNILESALNLEATLDTMKSPLKIDISTDDVITPKEVNYEYKLMFEERSISVLAYNLENCVSGKDGDYNFKGNFKYENA